MTAGNRREYGKTISKHGCFGVFLAVCVCFSQPHFSLYLAQTNCKHKIIKQGDESCLLWSSHLPPVTLSLRLLANLEKISLGHHWGHLAWSEHLRFNSKGCDSEEELRTCQTQHSVKNHGCSAYLLCCVAVLLNGSSQVWLCLAGLAFCWLGLFHRSADK